MKSFRQTRRQSWPRRMVVKPVHAEGNRAAVQEALGYPVQTKLKVGAPSDAHEREADAVADRVMAAPEGTVQRACAGCEQEEEKKKEAAGAGEMAKEEEQAPVAEGEPEKKPEEEVQRKEAGGETTVASADASAISARRGGGRPLPAAERAFFEPRLGANLSRVRVHADAQAAGLAERLSARAFTVGREIFFAHDQYRPGTTEGRRLLAHELTHVWQQKGRAGAVVQRWPWSATTPCPTASCAGYANTHCGAYAANRWWLPDAYVNNATLACRETPNHPTAMCVRKTLQDRLAATPAATMRRAAAMKTYETFAPLIYKPYVIANLTPRIYSDHVAAYRAAGCPSGPASYSAWIAVSTIPMPAGTVGTSIRYGGGSCSGRLGHWC